LVAFSPLGRGFLTGEITTVADLEPGDARRGLPRFQPEAIAANLRIVDQVRAIAANHGVTPAQIALAWVQAQGAVAIPGTRHRVRLDENAAAVALELGDADLAALDRAVTDTGITGERDTAAGLASMHA
jgi:aryl-alcohol dehydrogenase-like predicted oxidoreductase